MFFLYFYLFIVNLLFIFLYICPLYFVLPVHLHFPIKTISSKVFKNNVKNHDLLKWIISTIFQTEWNTL